ncbi:MAG TPA: SIMPL domain-containing protein [Aromatoleum sp.]|uniref:SIMPL domain-containing protein n=1 Tax=Aromatoleum sp. TaxID=2307007 RepID=UPI002B47F5EF|nr:SIMPL domain-containing protein [Aromatoleum sp.]HJV24269.1 SIMPL domain-containing protein [Aromatoleum sp.]
MNNTLLRRLLFILSLSLQLPVLAFAAAPDAPGERLPTIELSADASRSAPNDQATATMYLQADDKTPAALSRQVNSVIAAALEQARAYPTVRTRTAATTTSPIYSKEARRIDGWRMRSELQLESRDLPALTELLGKLQGSLALSSLVMQPSPETRKTAADLAAADALRAFQGRAQSIAGALGKTYRIRHLSVAYGNAPRPPYPVMRANAVSMEAAAVPAEAGESDVTVTVSGTIELPE